MHRPTSLGFRTARVFVTLFMLPWEVGVAEYHAVSNVSFQHDVFGVLFAMAWIIGLTVVIRIRDPLGSERLLLLFLRYVTHRQPVDRDYIKSLERENKIG